MKSNKKVVAHHIFTIAEIAKALKIEGEPGEFGLWKGRSPADEEKTEMLKTEEYYMITTIAKADF